MKRKDYILLIGNISNEKRYAYVSQFAQNIITKSMDYCKNVCEKQLNSIGLRRDVIITDRFIRWWRNIIIIEVQGNHTQCIEQC